MKIAISLITDVGPKSGLGVYANRLLASLSELDSTNHYTVYINQISAEDIPNYGSNFTVIPVWTPPKFHYWWEQIYILLNSNATSHDVIHFPISAPPFLTKSKVVVTIHDLTFYLFPETMTAASRFYWQSLMLLNFNRVAEFISVSDSTKANMLKKCKVSASKISVVPEYASEEFQPINDSETLCDVKHRYNLPDRFVLFVGTTEPRKNLIHLLKAFREIARRDLPHKLILVGKPGWGYKEVVQTIEDMELTESVSLVGYVPAGDLPAFYNLAEVFVFPSVYEGFGLPVLEAMSCGTPVVASNSSSLPEIVGDAGLLADAYSVDEWVDSLLQLLENSAYRSVLGKKALERASFFSKAQMAKQTLAVYRAANQL